MAPKGSGGGRRHTAARPAVEAGRLVFHEVDRERWPDFERLFQGPGGPKGCWCMVWRAKGEERRWDDGARRKGAMAGRIHDGVPVGILGYLDDEPVAWCSIAPRETHSPLGGLDAPTDEPGAVWSLVCFFVPRWLRGNGVTARLIEAAVDNARTRGATVVEAYPVDPDSPSYRFMGLVPTFQAAGFREVGRAGRRRHVMRRDVAS